jgi:Na+/proline symporter
MENVIASNLGTIDWAIIILYFAGMLFIGWWTSKKVDDSDDYVVAGRSLSMKVMVGTTVAGAMGSFAAIGQTGYYYKIGLMAHYLIPAWSLGWLTLLIWAKALRSSEATSIPDFFGIKFSRSTKIIASIITLVWLVNVTASQLAASGKVLQGLNLMEFAPAVILGSALIIAYTLMGGLYAVAYTDVVQIIILAIGFVIIMPLRCWDLVGGLSGIIEQASPEKLRWWGAVESGVILGWIVSFTLSCGSHPAYIQRILAAKDEDTAFWGTVWSNVLYFIMATPPLIIGLAGPIIFPNLAHPETLVPRLIAVHFPSILAGLTLAAILGVIMSTADSFLLLLGTTVSNDIYDEYVYHKTKQRVDKEKLLKVARWATFILGIFCTYLAISGGSVLKLYKYGAAAYGAGMFVPLAAATLFNWVTAKGANYGMLTGCTATIIWNALPLKASTGIDGVFVGTALCAIVLVVVSKMGATEKRLVGTNA